MEKEKNAADQSGERNRKGEGILRYRNRNVEVSLLKVKWVH